MVVMRRMGLMMIKVVGMMMSLTTKKTAMMMTVMITMVRKVINNC